MKKVLILPSWITSIDFYNQDTTITTRIGIIEPEDKSADYVIGLSIGGLEVLRNAGSISGKIILINPPLPHRSLTGWLGRWVRYIIGEGLHRKHQHFTKNISTFAHAFLQNIKLLTADFTSTLSKHSAQVEIIKGVKDDYFLDQNTSEDLKKQGIHITTLDAGHNWNEAIERYIHDLR